MGKPFRIDAGTAPATTTETTIGRDANGRFAQLVPPSPPQVVDRARTEGRSVDDVVADIRVPDHPVSETAKPAGGYREEKPWPAAGPVNDGNRKPMRVG